MTMNNRGITLGNILALCGIGAVTAFLHLVLGWPGALDFNLL